MILVAYKTIFLIISLRQQFRLIRFYDKQNRKISTISLYHLNIFLELKRNYLGNSNERCCRVRKIELKNHLDISFT